MKLLMRWREIQMQANILRAYEFSINNHYFNVLSQEEITSVNKEIMKSQ